MSKHNSLIKKIKKQILSVNDLIESYFNKIKYFKSNFKKILLNKENRVILGIGIVVILTLSYLLIPTFYSKDVIQAQIKNQILKNYNIDVQFNEKINYGLLPKPHFSAKNLLILRKNKKIGITNNLKVYISVGHFFSLNKIKMENLVFNKTDFNIYFDDLIFFENLLKTEPNENKIFFKRSNIFFKDKNEETLFINKINNSEFYYDPKKLQNILLSKNEIFNIPFKILIENDKFNKEVFFKFNSKKIRLDIETKTNYEKDTRNGLLDILFINKNTSINYQINKDTFKFSSKGNKNLYKGLVDLKPFYLSADFNYEGLSTKNLLNDDSIFIDLINSEILNNRNLSANLNFKVKDITNINELNNLYLKTTLEEGNINFSDSVIMWKKDCEIIFNDGLLTINDDGINIIGSVILNFKDVNNFYSSFQIKKNDRKKIKQIQVDFIYNLNSKSVRFDNPRVDASQNENLEIFLDDFNSKENRVFNKITFKNFVNNFFSAYAG